jgi:hypothetical protein
MNLCPDRDLSCSSLRERGTGTAHFTAIPEQREQQGIAGTAGRLTLDILFRSMGTCSSKNDHFSTVGKKVLFPNLGTAQKRPKQSRPFALFLLPRSAGKRLTPRPLLLSVKFRACRLLRRVPKCDKTISNCN